MHLPKELNHYPVNSTKSKVSNYDVTLQSNCVLYVNGISKRIIPVFRLCFSVVCAHLGLPQDRRPSWPMPIYCRQRLMGLTIEVLIKLLEAIGLPQIPSVAANVITITIPQNGGHFDAMFWEDSGGDTFCQRCGGCGRNDLW